MTKSKRHTRFFFKFMYFWVIYQHLFALVLVWWIFLTQDLINFIQCFASLLLFWWQYYYMAVGFHLVFINLWNIPDQNLKTRRRKNGWDFFCNVVERFLKLSDIRYKQNVIKYFKMEMINSFMYCYFHSIDTQVSGDLHITFLKDFL